MVEQLTYRQLKGCSVGSLTCCAPAGVSFGRPCVDAMTLNVAHFNLLRCYVTMNRQCEYRHIQICLLSDTSFSPPDTPTNHGARRWSRPGCEANILTAPPSFQCSHPEVRSRMAPSSKLLGHEDHVDSDRPDGAVKITDITSMQTELLENQSINSLWFEVLLC